MLLVKHLLIIFLFLLSWEFDVVKISHHPFLNYTCGAKAKQGPVGALPQMACQWSLEKCLLNDVLLLLMQLLRLGQLHVLSGSYFLKFVISAVLITVIRCVWTKLRIIRVLVLVRVFCHLFEILIVVVLRLLPHEFLLLWVLFAAATLISQ